MNQDRFPARVTDISDSEFWSALRAPKTAVRPEVLRAAVSLGQSGKKASGFRKLADYFADALNSEWERILKGLKTAVPPDPDALKDTLNHKIKCWHDQVVQFGDRIDWMPVSKMNFDSIAGFHYFGWFVPVLNAYIQTGDKRYGNFVVDIVEQYYAMRKDPRWKSTDGRHSLKNYVFNQLGAAARVEIWLKAYMALIHHGGLTTKASESLLKLLLGYGRALFLHSKEFWAHNIQTHGCRALFQLARTLPEFSESTRWDRRATERLCEQITIGFFSDGFHRERVWGYGSHTLSSLSQAYEFAQGHGGLGEYQAAYLKALRNAYRFYARSAGPRPKLQMPTYGDAGMGSRAHSILEHGRRFFPANTDENLGVDRTKSYLFRPSGFAIMRNGDDKDSAYVSVNFGKFAGWHSHWDLLSMNFWAYGEMLLEEECRFGPYGNPLDVQFRAPEAHNLLTIDGMVYDCREVAGEEVAWFSNDAVDYFSATHFAYNYHCFGLSKGKVSPNIHGKVRRTIVFVKDPGYLVVLDSVTDRSRPDRFNRAISQWWHSPFKFRQAAPDVARTKGRIGCILAYARQEGLVRLETGADFTAEEGKRLGASYDRYHLRARRWMGLNHDGIVGFATLVLPFKGKAPQVSINALDNDPLQMWRAEGYEIRLPDRTDTVVLNPELRDDASFAGRQFSHRALIQIGDSGEHVIE